MELLLIGLGFVLIALVFAGGFASGYMRGRLRDPGEDIRFPDYDPDYGGAV